MDARAVDDAARDLHESLVDEIGAVVLGPLMLGLSIAATQMRPEIVMPLFAGGLYLMGRVVVAEVHRFNLVDRLSHDRDAYTIPEVARRGRRAASMRNRKWMAVAVKHAATASPRLSSCSGILEVLAARLEQEDLELDPVLAVACEEFVTCGLAGAFDPTEVDPTDVTWRVQHILSGFTPSDG